MAAASEKVPAHLWIIGVLSLLWNAMGAVVYTLTMIRHPAVLQGADPAMVAAIEASPAWANAAWGLGVWGALAGSILLLCRRRLATVAFALSFAGLVVVGAYELIAGMPVNLPQTAAIWLIALFLLWYASFASAIGLLR